MVTALKVVPKDVTCGPSAYLRGLMIGEDRMLLEAVLFALDNQNQRISAGWASTLADARVKNLPDNPEIILFQASGSREDALEAIRELKAFALDAKLIVIGDQSSEEQILGFLEAGAGMFVSRDSSIADIVYSIEAMDRGEMSCSPNLIAMVVSRIRELSNMKASLQPGPLSARQKEIIQLISKGLSNKEIAAYLGVSTSTAKNHVHKVLKKLNAHRRRDAICKACEAEILTGTFPQPSSQDCGTHGPAGPGKQ